MRDLPPLIISNQFSVLAREEYLLVAIQCLESIAAKLDVEDKACLAGSFVAYFNAHACRGKINAMKMTVQARVRSGTLPIASNFISKPTLQ